MANSLLTPTAVTREALRILHQRLNFIGNIERQYDSSFAKSGAKIGDTLKIRLPNQYTVRTGPTLAAQETTETSTTLQIATQKGVDLNFSSVDLTLSLDDFSSRILEPAMAVLAANIEADALSMIKDVNQIVDNDGQAISFYNILQGREVLNNALAPDDDRRSALLTPYHSAKLVDALKGLYNSQEAIGKQYKTGEMGRTGGFKFFENTLLGNHTTGTAAKTTTCTISGANQTGSELTIGNSGSKTFKKGDIVTLAGCYRVHPESKENTGILQQFVVTEDAASTTLKVSPAIVTSGAKQNVSASPTDSGAIVKVGAGASELLNNSIVFHKEAFAFATADLVMPKGVDFAARDTMDGISLRVVRQYDINNDKFPCRLDVLYGYKTLRPELACRIHADA
jgi:hypothetical protein